MTMLAESEDASPDLSQEVEAARAPPPGEESAPINPAPHEHDDAEVPSFRPLSRRPTDAPKTSEKASLWKERSDGCAIATSDSRATARSSIGAGAVAKRVDGTPGEVPYIVSPGCYLERACRTDETARGRPGGAHCDVGGESSVGPRYFERTCDITTRCQRRTSRCVHALNRRRRPSRVVRSCQ
jgi:hypothetical protein